MQLTLHATRRTPHGTSRLVQPMSAWSVKTRRAPPQHCRGARAIPHTTMVIPLRPSIRLWPRTNIEYPPPPQPPPALSLCMFLFAVPSLFQAVKEWCDEHKCPLLFCTSFTGEGIVGLLRQIVISCFERHPPPSVLTLPYRNFH